MEDLIGGLIGGLIIGLASALLLPSRKPTESDAQKLGKRISDKVALDPNFAARVEKLFEPVVPPRPNTEGVRLLALLQQDARLLDFLMEEITAYDDSQIGASVRDIHAKAVAVVKKYLTIEPVRPEVEGSTVTIPAGFDASAVRLVGNVAGKPPFTGILQHRGWKVTRIELPTLAEGVDGKILAPAEVELS